MVGHASIDTSHVKLEDGEEWTKFQILVTLDQNGLLSLRSEITKQTIEMVDVPKKQEVEMSEEEYAEAVKKAQDAAKKKAEEEMKKKLQRKKLNLVRKLVTMLKQPQKFKKMRSWQTCKFQ